MEEPITEVLSVNCKISSENNLINMKKRSYMIITLFHDCCSEFETFRTELDARGSTKFQLKRLKDGDVEFDNLRIEIFSRRWLFFPDKHIGTASVYLSELLSSRTTSDRKINQEGSATYEIIKSSKQHKGDLKLWYKLSTAQEKKPEVKLSA